MFSFLDNLFLLFANIGYYCAIMANKENIQIKNALIAIVNCSQLQKALFQCEGNCENVINYELNAIEQFMLKQVFDLAQFENETDSMGHSFFVEGVNNQGWCVKVCAEKGEHDLKYSADLSPCIKT